MKDVLAEMERLNVTAVVFGDPEERAEMEGRCGKRDHPRNVFQQRTNAGAARAAR